MKVLEKLKSIKNMIIKNKIFLFDFSIIAEILFLYLFIFQDIYLLFYPAAIIPVVCIISMIITAFVRRQFAWGFILIIFPGLALIYYFGNYRDYEEYTKKQYALVGVGEK